MKYTFIIIALLFSCYVTAQIKTEFLTSKPDFITLKKSFFGYKFYMNGRAYPIDQIADLMKTNNEAYQLIRATRSNNTVSGIVGFIGGALMGWPIGRALGGEEMNWKIFALGAAITGVSIPISISAANKAKQAVKVWNSSLPASYNKNMETGLSVKVTPAGVGLVLNL